MIVQSMRTWQCKQSLFIMPNQIITNLIDQIKPKDVL